MPNLQSGPTLVYEPSAHHLHSSPQHSIFHSYQHPHHLTSPQHSRFTQLPSPSSISPNRRRSIPSTPSFPSPMVHRPPAPLCDDPSLSSSSSSAHSHPQSPVISAPSLTRRLSETMALTAAVKGKGKAVSPKKVKKERQTTIQEHLRTVKPGSPSPSTSSSKSSSAHSRSFMDSVVTKSAKAPKNKAAATAVVQSPFPSPSRVDQPQQILLEPITLAENPRWPLVEEELDVTSMAEDEVEARLSKEKTELMQRLASHGIHPRPDVLDHALQTMATMQEDGDEELTVQSFLEALDDPLSAYQFSPGTGSTPTRRLSEQIQATYFSPTRSSPSRSVSFNLVETTKTPAGPTAKITSSPGLAQSGATSPYAVSVKSTPTSICTTPPPNNKHKQYPSVLAPSPNIVTATPVARRTGRLNAFAPAPLRRSASSMVAAEIKGMGRVAMAKSVLVEHLGVETAEQAIAAAHDPIQALSFGDVSPIFGVKEPVIVDAFAASSSARNKAGADLEEDSADPAPVDERLKLVRSWLDSPEVTDEESHETWSSIPKEWDEDHPADRGDSSTSQSSTQAQVSSFEIGEEAEEDLEQKSEIRVGGKSVRVLLRTKRRRTEEDGHLDESAATAQPSEYDQKSDEQPLSDDENASYSSQRPSKAAANDDEDDEVHCICHRPDEGEPMVQCDDCRIWYHLQCLGIPSAKKLGKTWFCFRCDVVTNQSSTTPQKRSRVQYQRQVTPTFSHQEPVLVASAMSPRADGHFYYNSAADLVLAPSPQASSSRRVQPRSPIITAAPSTPRLTDSRSDYAPYSPLLYRSTRSRMTSAAGTVFDDMPASGYPGGQWDATAPLFSGYDDHELEEDLFRCSTPSRSLSSSALGSWGEGGLQTPVTSTRRGRTISGHIPSTPSQDFLSGLHHGSEDTHHYAQRLFASPAQHSSSSHPVFYNSPSSPLAPRGRTTSSNQRVNLSSSAHVFQSPVALPDSQWETPSRRAPSSRAGDTPSRTNQTYYSKALSTPFSYGYGQNPQTPTYFEEGLPL